MRQLRILRIHCGMNEILECCSSHHNSLNFLIFEKDGSEENFRLHLLYMHSYG